MKHLAPVVLVLLFLIVGCNKAAENAVEKPNEPKNEIKPVEVISMKLTSPAFNHNGSIPLEYTCDGANVLPELNIEDAPEKAKSLALIMDDPDAPAGTWVHWVLWNISPETKSIPKGAEPPKSMRGKTSFGRPGYGGPCPPSGTHRYFFKLYALDTILSIKEGSNKSDLEQAMQGHIIEKAELMGTYKRE